VLCRSTRSADPLRKVHDQLEFLVKAREFVRRNGLSERRD
jgi:TetR/AcrR family transcriptional regulator, lmrAB and yxaGH operons repressor